MDNGGPREVYEVVADVIGSAIYVTLASSYEFSRAPV